MKCNILCLASMSFLSVFSLQSQESRLVHITSQGIDVIIRNYCNPQDSSLLQKVTIMNHSPKSVWFCTDCITNPDFPVAEGFGKVIHTRIGYFSSGYQSGYLESLFISLTQIQPNTDTTISIQSSIAYNVLQSAQLIVDIDFIEDSKDIEMFLNSYEQKYVTGIPYEKYISKVVKCTVRTFP